MRKYLKNIIRSVIFLSLLLLSLAGINRVTKPKYDYSNSDWPTTSTYEQFYKMEKNSIDVLFLGSSVMVNAVSPMEIYEKYGIRSYNLGSENQSPVVSYFWLKEALRYQSPSVVVMDCRFLFSIHKENPMNMIEGLVRKSIDPMKWSSVKMEAVHDICKIDEGQDELSYYLTNLRYHERWKVLTRDDYDASMQSAPLLGYAPIYGNGPTSFEAYWPSNSAEVAEFDKQMELYLIRITELCRENNIELILIDLPGNNMNDAVNNALCRYADQNGIEYFNYCEASLYAAIGAELPAESVMAHANLPGALKFSNAIGKVLKDMYHIPSVQDEQYEKNLIYHHHIQNTDELKKTDDFKAYLSLLKDPLYTVFFSVNDDAGELDSEILERWKDLGLQTDLNGMYEYGYYAVVSQGRITEQSGTGYLSKTEQFNENRSIYTIESAGRSTGAWSSVRIDGTEYSLNMAGINIVVYDTVFSKVIDSVNYEVFSKNFVR